MAQRPACVAAHENGPFGVATQPMDLTYEAIPVSIHSSGREGYLAGRHISQFIMAGVSFRPNRRWTSNGSGWTDWTR